MKKIITALLFSITLVSLQAHEPVVTHFFESDCSLVVPNAFTPNGDGINDEFYVTIPKDCVLQLFELRIFDQYGREVFNTNDANEKWDGTYDGLPLPGATYLWKLTAQFEFSDEVIDKKGTLLVMK